MLITFEGGEGTGKSTQIRRLAEWLKSRGKKVVVTREPGGTPLADWIRKILLNPKNKGMDPFLELLLYESARKDHVEKVIRPALGKGMFVLCDRFVDATLAYQGYGRRLSRPLIGSLNRSATGDLHPRLTFLFDLPIGLGLKRARESKGRTDRLESETAAFHRRVRRGYLTLARKEKKRFCVIDTRRPRDEVAGLIVRAVKRVL